MPISYQDQKNFSNNQRIPWLTYGIQENDLNLEYYEIQKKYPEPGKLFLIQMFFIYPQLDSVIKKDVNLPEVFKLLDKDTSIKLNPYLLLLGYWVNQSSTNQNERFKTALKDMKEWKNYNVEPEDLVRYYNFWKQKNIKK
jgi:hypothetical protein